MTKKEGGGGTIDKSGLEKAASTMLPRSGVIERFIIHGGNPEYVWETRECELRKRAEKFGEQLWVQQKSTIVRH
jgi:hypothetical protein